MRPGLCHLPPQIAGQAAKSDVLEGRCVFIHLKKKKIYKSHYRFLLYFPLRTSFFFLHHSLSEGGKIPLLTLSRRFFSSSVRARISPQWRFWQDAGEKQVMKAPWKTTWISGLTNSLRRFFFPLRCCGICGLWNSSCSKVLSRSYLNSCGTKGKKKVVLTSKIGFLPGSWSCMWQDLYYKIKCILVSVLMDEQWTAGLFQNHSPNA